jgi:hypothetical protein
MFGGNNNNLAALISFGEVMKRLRRSDYDFDEESGRNWGCETFVGHDTNDMYVDLSRDGEDTAYMHLPKLEWLEGVLFDNIEVALWEYGFDLEHSTWYQDGAAIREKDEPGYIYVLQMQGTNLCKIGRTKNYKSRVDLLGVLMPKPCDFVGVWQTQRMRNAEAVLHMDYSPHHSNGEWFEIKDMPRLVGYMDQVMSRVK